MKIRQTFVVTRTCDFCSNDNQIHVATEGSLDHEAVRCSTCGGVMGTIGTLREPANKERQVAPAE